MYLRHTRLVGTFSLQASSYVESVAAKIRRQIEELERTAGTTAPLTVDGVAVDAYMTR